MYACRAGLYKQLATLKGLVEEYREQPQANQTLRGPIVQNLAQTGLDQDCPFRPAPADHDRGLNGAQNSSAQNSADQDSAARHSAGHQSDTEPERLSPEAAEKVSEEEFSEYVSRVYQYLQVS